MNWRRIAATAFLSLVVIFGMTGCPLKPPATPGAPNGPDSTWTGVNAVFRCSTTVPKGNIRYAMDWADKIDTTDESYGTNEPAIVAHKWTAAGTYDIKVQAFCDADSTKASDWSPTKSVKVILNGAPVVDRVEAPPVAVKDIEAFFTVFGSDPDNDSIQVHVKWPSGDTTTGYFPSPCSVQVSHVFTQIETAAVIVTIQDWKGTPSPEATVYVPVGKAGGVIWWWWSSDPENGEAPLTTSGVIVNDGDQDCVFSGCEDDYHFYAVTVAKGKDAGSVTTKTDECVFTGHPGYNRNTGHIIVGSEEGELYALNTKPGKDWQWPNLPETSQTNVDWSAPTFNGDKIYAGNGQDSLYLFQDAISQGNRLGAYYVGSGIVDAPIVDASGNVIFGTDSGYLVKIDGNLTSPLWRAPLLGNGEIHNPMIGSDGTIFCASESSRLYALDPGTGSTKAGWPVVLEGDVYRPVLGATAMFVGNSYGKVYSINPATGAKNWERQVSASANGFSTAPVVTDSGLLYIQNDADTLYCLRTADGTTIWACDCKSYGPRSGGNPHHPRRLQLADYAPNPTITAAGNIIVFGSDACYCVAGYPEATLDLTAPWPKWQKDVYNSGSLK